MPAQPFWQRPLSTLSDSEWEALCDGCGQCCMQKFEDEDSAEILLTDIPCALFDAATCRCRDYANRLSQVDDCLDIRSFTPTQFRWLPPHCAYRLRAEDLPLPPWHPLISGAADSAEQAGVSMRDHCAEVPEAVAGDEAALEAFVAERIWAVWD